MQLPLRKRLHFTVQCPPCRKWTEYSVLCSIASEETLSGEKGREHKVFLPCLLTCCSVKGTKSLKWFQSFCPFSSIVSLHGSGLDNISNLASTAAVPCWVDSGKCTFENTNSSSMQESLIGWRRVMSWAKETGKCSTEPTMLGPCWFNGRAQNSKLWPCYFFLTPPLHRIFSSIFTRLWQPITLV